MTHRANTPVRGALVLGVALAVGLSCSHAQAQRRELGVGLSTGSGLSLGTGGGQGVVLERTPVFLDAVVRSWTDEARNPVVGGALRIEVDRRVSVGVVPRVEWDAQLGGLTLRPFAGVPFFFAPFSLLGVEVGLAMAHPLGSTTGIVFGLAVDAYVWGSDLPGNSALIMINASLGFELDLAP